MKISLNLMLLILKEIKIWKFKEKKKRGINILSYPNKIIEFLNLFFTFYSLIQLTHTHTLDIDFNATLVIEKHIKSHSIYKFVDKYKLLPLLFCLLIFCLTRSFWFTLICYTYLNVLINLVFSL